MTDSKNQVNKPETGKIEQMELENSCLIKKVSSAIDIQTDMSCTPKKYLEGFENGDLIKTSNVDAINMDDEKSPSSPRRQRTCSSSSYSGSIGLNVDCSSPSPSPISIGSPASRLIQIRREESVDEVTREIAKERDVTSAMILSKSLDETSWLGDKNLTEQKEPYKRDSIDEMLFNPATISSPVRFIDKIYTNRSLTPSPIGVPISPKQRTFRRSLSPSSLRPSSLTSKRKLDTDETDCSPAKRSYSFFSPVSTLSSISSSSSPDPLSDSNRYSYDDDSGSEHTFLPQQTSQNNHHVQHTIVSTINNITPLTCDTRPGQPFVFVKPKHFAPQSPLAAGVTSANCNPDNRRSSLSSYTFTPVKD